MKNLTPELIAKAKAAKSAEELLALAKENDIELTEAEAKTCFEQLHANVAVSDDELEAVAGGGAICDSLSDFFENFFRSRSRRNDGSCSYCGDKANQAIHPIKPIMPDKPTFDSSVTPRPYDSNDKNKIEYL